MTDAKILATRLDCSIEAVELCRGADVVDLHLDTFIWSRIVGYDVFARHAGGPFGRRFGGHVDVPRLSDGGVTGGMWSITTNPFRSAARRWAVFRENLTRLRALIAGSSGVLAEVRTLADYRAARARGAHACFLAIQGLHAVEAAPESVASIPDDCVLRATLVHLTDSCYGGTSSPLSLHPSARRLTAAGAEVVHAMNARRMFVDLAHIHESAFWDAVTEHDRTQPLIDTHTGVAGVTKHWRNLTDDQVRAIADTGGVVGIIFAEEFLKRDDGPQDAAMIVDHVAHVIDVAGEDVPGLGSDYDGMITPPPDVPGVDAYPKLVQHARPRLARGAHPQGPGRQPSRAWHAATVVPLARRPCGAALSPFHDPGHRRLGVRLRARRRLRCGGDRRRRRGGPHERVGAHREADRAAGGRARAG
jgi:membrane dipeptidase